MRISNGKSTTKELAFKADKKPKEEHDNPCCESDEEEAKFVRKLKRGSGKYKCKLPVKCFNCIKFCHYASKFPKKKKDYDPREKIKKVQKDKNKDKNRGLYVQ